MSIYKGKQGTYILESKPLAKGGEGAIYKINGNNNIVAKIYFKPTKELEEKLTYMSNNPPDKSVLNDIAWPLDILYDGGSFCGFIMPKMEAGTELGELYKFNPDKEPVLTYQHRIIIAINICKVISAVHNAGYTFGDFNQCNIGVNLKNGHVGFFDTDSYHIRNRIIGKTYRCGVCLPGYVAPELIQQCKGKDFLSAPLPTFTQETDRFALAIHIFKLLMNGFTPFNGIKDNETISTASPGTGNQAIERDNYCFKLGNKPQSLAVPNLSSFPTTIQDLFTRAFIDGRKNPRKRPTADEWEKALTNYLNNEITVCSRDKNHYYYKVLSACPYCEAERRYLNNLNKGKGQMSFSQPINVPGSSSSRTSSYSSTTNSKSSSSYSNTSVPLSGSYSYNNYSGYSNYSGYNSRNSSYSSSNNNSSYSGSNNSTSSYNTNTFNQQKKKQNKPLFLIIIISILVLIGAIVISKVNKSLNHSANNVSISLIEKTNVESTLNGYTYSFKVKVDNSNNEAINGIGGYFIIKDYNSNVLMNSTAAIYESISAKGSKTITLTSENNTGDLAKTLWNSKLDNLNVYFRITELSFEDGTRKKFTSSKDVLIHKASSEYKKQDIKYANSYDRDGLFWGDWSLHIDTPYIKNETLYVPVEITSDIDITWEKGSDGNGEMEIHEALCSQGSNFRLDGYFEYDKQSTSAGETQNITLVIPLGDWVDFDFYEYEFHLCGSFDGCEYQTSDGYLTSSYYTDSPANPYNERAYLEIDLSIDW